MIEKENDFIERIIQSALSYDNVVVDCFAGLGGVTEGFEASGKFKVVACINHWPLAIKCHKANHPDCLHLEEDFRTADISLVKYIIEEIRRRNPSVKVHGWFSLECTNFSNAKGGMPRDADSRTLADHMDRYVIALDPDVIWVENVKEFLLWGPMIPKCQVVYKGKKKTIYFNPDKDDASTFFDSYEGELFCPLVINKKKKIITPWLIPDPAYKAQDFNRWNNYIETFGYNSHHKLLNAANFGVPQHRIRLIMQFTRPDAIPMWPEHTHDKKGVNGLEHWVAIKGCLDLNDEGEDLLSFKVNKKGEIKPRIKSPKTIQRLIKGCIKHVLKGDDTFIINYNHSSSESSLNDASPSLLASERFAVAKAHLIDNYFGNGFTKPITDPANVNGQKDGASLSTIQFITQHYSEADGDKNISIEKPSRAITGTGGNLSLTTAQFIDKQYGGNEFNHQSIEQPAGGLTQNPKLNLQTLHFIDQQYSGGQQNKGVDEPAGGITNIPKQKLIEVDKFIMDTQFNNDPHSIDEPSNTLLASRKHYYVISAHWFNQNAKSIDDVSGTIIARMDKTPPYLVVTEEGSLALEVYEHDPPHYKLMKQFMAHHGIANIRMRMLKISELKKIMTIPDRYEMVGSETDQKKMIGNAVPCEMVTAIADSYDGNKLNTAKVA